MSLSLAPLLIESDDVPLMARRALRMAQRSPEDERATHLETAARSLYREGGLDCDDARELVGLSAAGSCP
jgi:predicted Zn-ribbon and HTH transcriptional regulator